MNQFIYNQHQYYTMDTLWIIRSIIFLIASLTMIIFPEKVNRFQNHILEKFHIKYKIRYEKNKYHNTGIIFIIISMILFVFSIIN